MNDIGNPVELQAGIKGGTPKETGAFGGVFAGGVDLAGPVVIFVLDEPHLRRRREVNGADATGRFGGVATHFYLERIQQRAHLLTSRDGAIKRGDHADVMAEGGEVFRQGGRSVP